MKTQFLQLIIISNFIFCINCNTKDETIKTVELTDYSKYIIDNFIDACNEEGYDYFEIFMFLEDITASRKTLGIYSSTFHNNIFCDSTTQFYSNYSGYKIFSMDYDSLFFKNKQEVKIKTLQEKGLLMYEECDCSSYTPTTTDFLTFHIDYDSNYEITQVFCTHRIMDSSFKDSANTILQESRCR